LSPVVVVVIAPDGRRLGLHGSLTAYLRAQLQYPPESQVYQAGVRMAWVCPLAHLPPVDVRGWWRGNQRVSNGRKRGERN
jgi:hypothetical protein